MLGSKVKGRRLSGCGEKAFEMDLGKAVLRVGYDSTGYELLFYEFGTAYWRGNEFHGNTKLKHNLFCLKEDWGSDNPLVRLGGNLVRRGVGG